MQKLSRILPVSFLGIGFLMAISSICKAQVIPDITVNTQVNQNGNVTEITGGNTQGNNLFHSFQDFSVSSGNEAFFNNANNISRIFSRVTGGNISNIDGIIRANGNANLFLINPAGIIFGENARLDIGGSFYGSTATSILFEDGEFSAVDNLSQPILTINAPIGLSFRENPGEIVNNSVANNGRGLEVNSGNSLSLLGGNITFNGGRVTAPQGIVNLAGLSAPGEITIEGDHNFSFPEGLSLANLSLSNNSIVDLRGGGGGLIAVNVDNLSFTGESLFTAGIPTGMGEGDATAGTIAINANNISANQNSQIRSDNFGTGAGGRIEIITNTLDFVEDSAIVVSSFGVGNAGTVNITAQDISFDNEWGGIYSNIGLTRIATEETLNDAVGNAGRVDITTETLSVTNGAKIAVNSVGTGNAGTINIAARDEVSFSGTGSTPVPAFDGGTVLSGAFSQVQLGGIGNSGEVNIIADSFSFTDLGSVLVDNSGVEGDAGDINLEARDNIFLETSLIFAQVQSEAVGNGGNINITANSLESKAGSQILADTQGRGNAGNIVLDVAETIILDENTAVITRVGENALGNAGNITINANSLIMDGGSSITSQSSGQGNSGEIAIVTREVISLDNQSQISSQVTGTGLGNGANVSLASEELSLANESLIIADNFGQNTNPNENNTAGSINLEIAGDINLENGNQIQSQLGENILGGNPGKITINAGGSIFAQGGNSILSGSQGNGDGGDIEITAGGEISLNNDLIFAEVESGAVGNGGNITITANSFTAQNSSSILADSQGRGNAGNISLDIAEEISLEGETSIITRLGENAFGRAGNVNIKSQSLVADNGASIVSQTNGEGDGGEIIIATEELISLNNQSRIISQVTETGLGNGGNIFLTSGELNFRNNSLIIAGIRSQNDRPEESNIGGDINIDIVGDINLDSDNQIQSQVGIDTFGDAGKIFINAGGSINSTNGNLILTGSEGNGNSGDVEIRAGDEISFGGESLILANTSGEGVGDAGRVTIEAGNNFTLSESLILSQIQDAARGNAGGIEIVAKAIAIADFSLISTNAQRGSSGMAGNISFSGETIKISSGAVVDALTENSFAGGNINLSARDLIVSSGGAIATATDSSGNAGNINLDLTGDIKIDGEGITSRPEDIFPLREEILQEIEPLTGLFANSSRDSAGNGGNINLTTGDNLSLANRGIISVDNQGRGDGGFINLNSNSLALDNQATISAITSSGTGGNLQLTIEDRITLNNSSLISTQALANGNGGNIAIDTNFIIAFPNGNNDIVANANLGQGGNINITAQSIFGIQERDSNPVNNTNDINASSEFGLNGTVSIATFNTNRLEGLAELPENIVEPQPITTKDCRVNTNSGVASGLFLKGKGGIISPPELPLTSENIAIAGEIDNSITPIPEPISTSQGKIQPARGIQLTERGQIILTAYPTNNAGERIPRIKSNCAIN